MSFKIINGDCREILKTLPSDSFDCVVTSPPYWGLRDYGVDGQIGLEPTMKEYLATMVEVFRELRRVLKPEGTCWLNIGDSYAANTKGSGGAGKSTLGPNKDLQNIGFQKFDPRKFELKGLKPKDLCMIPNRLAILLQEPWHCGRMKNDMDRIWLAAMVDGEGCIYIHKRKAGGHAGDGYFRQSDGYQCAFEIANTCEAIVARCLAVTGVGSISRQDKDRRQPIFRWTVRSNEARDLLREIYPFLVGKQHQARLAYAVTSSGKHSDSAWEALKVLHSGSTSDVDFPAPPSCFEQGWFVRSEIIWSKPNPMPESVRDRPTSAHEKVWLLTKSEKYFYDADAIAEDGVGRERYFGSSNYSKGSGRNDAGSYNAEPCVKRNARNVWVISPKPFKGAHFATMPPDLAELCIKAGCPVGGMVLDPFGGAGTTGLVAEKLGRHATLIELNNQYVQLADDRIVDNRKLI